MFRNIKIAAIVLAIASIASAQDRATALIDKGLDYLKTQQQPDGGWAHPHEPPGFTALALRAFVLDPKYSADTDFVKHGYDKLLSYQQPDGGIYEGGLANYNTAIAISSLAAANNPQFKPTIEKAVAYLKSLQWMDMAGVDPSFKYQGEKDAWYGGWGYSNKTHTRGRPDLSNTQMALDALHDAGVSPDDPAYKAAIKFVTRMQNSSETNDQAWAGNDGGFVYTPGDDRKGNSAAGDFTSPEGDHRLRSYGSMTYAGLKSFIYAGLSKSDPRVKAAWDWITKNWTLSENPGMRLGNPDNAQQGMYYYYHTLSRAMSAFDQPTIADPQGVSHDWRIELIDKLASLQKPDGSWAGDKRWMEDNPVLVTSYCVLALEEAEKDLKANSAK